MLELFPGLMLQTLTTALAVVLAVALLLRPRWVRRPGGVVFASVTVVALPLLLLFMGASQHIEHTKETVFCLGCHAMYPYGQSLLEEEQGVLAAAHYQDGLVPPEHACFSCHTEYTLFGGLRAKTKGLQHMWYAYVAGVPDPIALYDPYSNRECLYCHGSARSFRTQPAHEGSIPQMADNELSCLLCHGPAHGVEPGEVHAAEEGTRDFRLPEAVVEDGGPAWIH